ncbi:MAG: hypothetical protein ACTHK7_18470 [Aureliella sp.]
MQDEAELQDSITALRKACAALGTHDHRIVAFHEAAHIVVGEHFGKRLIDVQLDDTPGRPGYCKMEWPAEIQPQQGRSWDWVICMAEPLMDRELVGKINEETDFHQVRMALAILKISLEKSAVILPQLPA